MTLILTLAISPAAAQEYLIDALGEAARSQKPAASSGAALVWRDRVRGGKARHRCNSIRCSRVFFVCPRRLP